MTKRISCLSIYCDEWMRKMAEYSVKTGPLNEAGENFSIFAGELGMFKEKLDTILSKWQEGMPELRRQLAGSKESINEISRQSRNIGKTLYEITDFYIRAERSAISGHIRDLNINIIDKQPVILPNIRSSSGVVVFERRILPDWLQLAVLEYEQSQG